MKTTILDEWADGCGVNIEISIPMPTDLQSFFSGVTEYKLKTSIRYSSVSLTVEQKQTEVTAQAPALANAHIEETRKKFRLHGTTLEV